MTPLRHKTVTGIYAIPLLIALVSFAGLTSALLADDVWDVLSWMALLTPIAIFTYGWHRRRP